MTLYLKGYGFLGSALETYLSTRRMLYGLFLRAPGVRSKVQAQIAEATAKLETRLVPQGPGITRYLALPKEGWTDQQVRTELQKLGEMEHTRWEDGRVSGAVYHGEDNLIKLQAEAFQQFSVANPIHPDVFPGVRKMEAEIVAMVLAMFNAPSGAAGVTTSGGTESILMACLSAREKAYTERGVTEPEMYVQIHGYSWLSNWWEQDRADHRSCSFPKSGLIFQHQDPSGLLSGPKLYGPYPERIPFNQQQYHTSRGLCS